MRDGLQGLRAHAIVGRHHHDGDVGDLGAARAHRAERLPRKGTHCDDVWQAEEADRSNLTLHVREPVVHHRNTLAPAMLGKLATFVHAGGENFKKHAVRQPPC